MHILFFSTMNGSPWGGSEELWYKTAKLALKEGYKVAVVYKYWGENEHHKIRELGKLGGNLIYRDQYTEIPRESKWYTKLRHRLKMHFNVHLPAFEPSKLKSAYEDLLPKGVDVVFFSQGATFDLALSKKYHTLVDQLKIPYIIISQFNKDFGFSLSNKERTIAITIMQNAKKVFFVSKRNHTFAEHQLASPIDNYALTANSLNIDNLSPLPYNIKTEAPVFVSVGRLDVKTKGIDLQIKCFGEPSWKNRAWTYLIYGDGPDRNYLQDLIYFYGLEDRVKLCGFAEDIRAIWAKGHILLQPSIAEGTPLTLQEAMFCGKPAIVTDIAGNTELIKEGYNGFVAAGPVFKALSVTLERAYEQRDRWSLMGKNAHETATEKIDQKPEVALLDTIVKDK